MTTTLNERPGPAGFPLAYPRYRSTALLDRLRATEYSYLDAGGHVYLGQRHPGIRQVARRDHAVRTVRLARSASRR